MRRFRKNLSAFLFHNNDKASFKTSSYFSQIIIKSIEYDLLEIKIDLDTKITIAGHDVIYSWIYYYHD